MKLNGKKILVLGLANKNSIAWGIIQKLKAEGAEVGICYFHSSNKKRVEPLSIEAGASFLCEVDATNLADVEAMTSVVKDRWGTFDGIVHSIAYASPSSFEKRFHETSYEEFQQSLNISAFSLILLTQKLKPLFNENFSIMAMTCYGSTKVLAGYNVMGIAKAALESIVRYLAQDLGPEGVRVNVISAGPIKTLAALGIGDFGGFLQDMKAKSPVRKNVTIEDVGNLASFLMSDESSTITGQTLFVDAGMSIIMRQK